MAHGDTIGNPVEALPTEARSGIESIQRFVHQGNSSKYLHQFMQGMDHFGSVDEQMTKIDTGLQDAAERALGGELGEAKMLWATASGAIDATPKGQNARSVLSHISRDLLGGSGDYHQFVDSIAGMHGTKVRLPLRDPNLDPDGKMYDEAYKDTLMTAMALGDDYVRVLDADGRNDGVLRRIKDPEGNPTSAWLRVKSTVTDGRYSPENVDNWVISVVLPPNGKDPEFTPEARERALKPVEDVIKNIEEEAQSGVSESPIVADLKSRGVKAGNYSRNGNAWSMQGYELPTTLVELAKHPGKSVTGLRLKDEGGKPSPMNITAGQQAFSVEQTDRGVFLRNETLRSMLWTAAEKIDPALPKDEISDYKRRLSEEIENRVSIRIEPGQTLDIGREAGNLPVIKADKALSRDHFSVSLAEDGTVSVQDRGANGTDVRYDRTEQIDDAVRNRIETDQKLAKLRAQDEADAAKVRAEVTHVQRRPHVVKRVVQRVMHGRRNKR